MKAFVGAWAGEVFAQVEEIEMIEQFLEHEARLMDEALARVVKLGRPFQEQEVFEPAWKLGYELHPALDESRFQLYREAHWQGKGERKKFIPRLWVVRTDEQAAIEDSIRSGDFDNIDFEFPVVARKLSLRATAQIDGEAGELEICTKENGIEGFTVEEALELRELLNETYTMLYALANR